MKYTKFTTALMAIFLSVNPAYALFDASDSWIGEPFSGFKKTRSAKGREYMVSTADELATNAGTWALEKGGSAIDAAIAAQLVLNVVEPHSSGIGGGGFLLYYDAKNKNTIYYNGREKAPEKAFPTMFLDKNGQPRAFKDAVRGGLSVGTPGLLKIMKEAHQVYGYLPWEILFEPAIDIATKGFRVDERMHKLSEYIGYLQDFDEAAEIYLDKNKKPRQVGDMIYNPKLAQTFKILAEEGIDSFYKGQVAKDIVRAVQKSKINPGYLSLADLRNYKSKRGDLICATYRVKFKVCSMPLPSSGGVTVLQILGILENFELSDMRANSAESIHLIAEATKLAYADRNEYVADVADVPVTQMLNKVYLRNRSQLIDLKKAAENVFPGEFEGSQKLAIRSLAKDDSVELPSTTHISVVDKQGNAVALTSSIEYFFGSAISVDGFMLNNQLTDFSFRPKINGKLVANRVQAGKQPRSSMSPTFVFDENDSLVMTLGSPGGPRIIQFTVKTILNHIDWKMDVQKAISEPNFVALNGTLELEKDTKIARLKNDLANLGHKVEVIDIVSGINAITVGDTQKLRGGADPRRQGFADGK